jgi:hypothetical protein
VPFKRPFKTEFSDGDLVYGIREKRTSLVMHLGVRYATKNGDFSAFPMTVDQLDVDKSKVLPQSSAMWKQFHKDILNHKKYQTYTHVTKSGAISDEALQTGGGFSESTVDSAIRRKCKFGLYWTITNGFHIHFCLDGLSMAQITRKSFKTDRPLGRKPQGREEARTKLRAVTGAELRWIYRHRNVPAVQQHVQFWENNAAMGPPWDEPERQEIVSGRYVRWRDLWAGYKPVRQPTSLALDVDESEQASVALPKIATGRPLARCSECGAADEALLTAPNGALVCDPCRRAGLREDEQRREALSRMAAPRQSAPDPLRCSKCPKTRQRQSSWFWNRWHQCASCERIYCDSCGSGLEKDFLEAVGKSIRVPRICRCGGETELIY